MIRRNPCMGLLKTSYLFPEVRARASAFLQEHPEAKLISLGIGDWTAPLPSSITRALMCAAEDLGTQKGYTGYGPEQGIEPLREGIASTFYPGRMTSKEIFVSDGAKCDIGRLQMLFGGDISIAVQDPAYPVYVDGSLIQGVKHIFRMPSIPQNHFFPQLVKADILYFCSPNNPTGAVLTRSQMEELVHFARKERMLILFDAAYASYIRDPALPKSIYDIPGAEEVAIELGSFSKLAGFTGIRLGWTVVPEALKYADGTSIRSDWQRVMTTLFNGASIVAQKGGIAALQEEGRRATEELTDCYLENARLIKNTWQQRGYTVYGGDHSPYVWIHFPDQHSWDIFQKLLEKTHLITTPGSGFGPSGEGFIRMSAYGSKENIQTAMQRVEAVF